MTPQEAYAYYIFDELTSVDMIELANYWLENNIVTDGFCQLCYVDVTKPDQIDKNFKAGFSELNILEPTIVEAGLIIIRKLLKEIVSGKLDAMVGINYIYFELHDKMAKDLKKDGERLLCLSPSKDKVKYFNEDVSGVSFNLTQLFGWQREIWDCRDGSYINYYDDISREEAEKRMYQHLIEESKNWLEADSMNNH